MKKEIYLNSIYSGNVEYCYGLKTAINKYLVEGRLYLSFEGLEGDECADLRHHGGCERALHQYPSEHYAYWQQKYSSIMDWVVPGMVSVDEPLILIAQEPNAMTLREVCDIFFGDPLNQNKLLMLKQQRKLSESWKCKVIARLESQEVERWDFRLLGHEETL
ncbi:hypothetical protein C0W42_19375 [Photobacterium kishitanii]|uniref:hypothetical protein n=1 Tax=Photobacterium kishitanii TaxID=318456 RepID=UPI000D1694E4|nr:hypothetical protein [Photobacterium kishitanii]PSU86721.1 hypothetical protein C0W42_19375 [Photobacterium kishitanii]